MVESAESQMRLFSWNLNRGRAAGAWQAIARDHGADVVLLQEATKPQWEGVCEWEAVPPQPWGSGVIATDGQLQRVEVPGYKGWVTGARWSRGTKASVKEVYVFSIHSPTHHKEAPRRSYIREARTIVDRINRVVPGGAPLIIGGDFNFASLGERVDGERLATHADEQKALDEFRTNGFLVAWRDLHPAAPLAQTLRWTGNKTTPFHCDGYLVRGLEASRLTCEVLLNEQFDAVSDHRPLTLVYAPE
jgi:endonuclease/exonuclease/phosphatase family metal-dependent hydrolase